MTPERQAIIQRDARELLRAFTDAAIVAIAAGHYGARDAQFAVAVLAGCEHGALIMHLKGRISELEERISELEERISELESDLKTAQDDNAEDEATLRRLLSEACEIIEANCTGFSERVEEMLVEADV